MGSSGAVAVAAVGDVGGGVVDDVSSVLTSDRVATSANHLGAQEPHKSHMRVL